MPELTVVISTIGNYGLLERVLDGYLEQDASPGGFELIVVCDRNNPDPACVDAMLASRDLPARRLSGTVPGLSANRNLGARAAGSPLILFTDDDTVPSRSLVSAHLAAHAREPAAEIAVLGRVRWSPEVRVGPFMHWLDHGIQFDFPRIDGDEAGWGRFFGANVSLKRELFERVGGFDEERLPYGYEDLDFGYRAEAEGMILRYVPDAVVDHLRQVDLGFWRERAPRIARSERAFVSKHPELEPWFHRMFTDAAARPPARGRGRHLIRLIPRGFPWLGELVWRSADLYYRQAIAPAFLTEWERLAAQEGRDEDSLRSQPGGS